MHGFVRGGAEGEAFRLDRCLIQPVLGAVQRLYIAEGQTELVLYSPGAARTECQRLTQHPIAANDTAQIPASIILILPGRSGKSASAHELVSSTEVGDRKSTRLNSSHLVISYAVFC